MVSDASISSLPTFVEEEVVAAPPKPIRKVKKGKAKAKGRGKKGKAKAKGKTKKILMLGDGDADADIVEDAKSRAPKASGIRKKILAQLEMQGKTVEEGIKITKAEIQGSDAQIQEAEAFEKAQAAQEEEARTEFEKEQKNVHEAMAEEMAGAAKFREISEKRDGVRAEVNKVRSDLVEAQKALAMLEVMALNHARMKELEVRRKAAADAADAARRNLVEQRQREKEALEATKRLLEEARNARKGGKRAAPDGAMASPAKRGGEGGEPATKADEAEDIE